MSKSDHKPGDESLSVSLDKLAETIPVAIIMVNRNGEIDYANRKAEEVFGVEEPDTTSLFYPPKLEDNPLRWNGLPLRRTTLRNSKRG